MIRNRAIPWITAALAGAAAASGGSPAPQAGPVHTLEGYVAYARQHSPALAAGRDAVDARRAAVRQALYPQHPMVMAEVELGMETRLAGIGVSQMLMFPGKTVLERKGARFAAESEQARLDMTAAALEADVRRAYAALYQTGRTIARMRESVALMKQAESAARAAYSAGMESQAGLLRMQVEIASMEDEIRGMEIEGASQRQRLAALIGLGDGGAIPFPDSLPALTLELTDDEVIARLQAQNPSLRAMDRELDASATMTRMAASRFLPDMTLSAEYMTRMNGMPGSPGGWNLGVALDLPLWVGRDMAAVQEARAMQSAMLNRRLDMANLMAAEARMMLAERADAERRVRFLREVLLPQARQALELVQTDYAAGKAEAVAYLDAQRSLLDLQTRLVREQVRRENAVAGVVAMLGGTSGAARGQGGAR